MYVYAGHFKSQRINIAIMKSIDPQTRQARPKGTCIKKQLHQVGSSLDRLTIDATWTGRINSTIHLATTHLKITADANTKTCNDNLQPDRVRLHTVTSLIYFQTLCLKANKSLLLKHIALCLKHFFTMHTMQTYA